MKNNVKLTMFLFFGLTSLVYIFPFAFVDAAKLESGVTINPPPPTTDTTTTDTTCPGPDENGDGVDDMTGEPCPAPTRICPEPTDENGDGVDDMTGEPCPLAGTGPASGTCGLVIMDGVPINYGALNLGQDSPEQEVTVHNQGTSQTPAKLMIKAGDWLSDAAGNPIIFPTTITHVAIAPNLDYDNKKPLTSAGWELGQISGGQTIPIYFQMKPAGATDASLNNFAGSLHQDVTIDLLC